ncbi:CBS domain-containing protein [Candidatus Pacearchaeota archaeon]|nr:CBS domain-containing protein [Candidatus Pacearchaeota archaeon]
MKVSEIMNKAMVVEDDISLKEAAEIMSEKNIGSLIVMKKDSIAGIITDTDILKNISNLSRKISQFMSKSIVTIEHNEDIDNAAQLMAKYRIKRLPVIKKGVLIGILTATDLIANSDALNEAFFFE